MIEPTKIDLTKPTFISNGTEYYIYNDGMAYDRIVEFFKLMPKIQFSHNFYNIHSWVSKLYEKVRNVEKLGDVMDVGNDLFNFLKESEQKDPDAIVQAQIEITYDFCCLFIVTKDEDMTVIEDRHFENKKTDWKKDMNFQDFFYCLSKL